MAGRGGSTTENDVAQDVPDVEFIDEDEVLETYRVVAERDAELLRRLAE